MSMLKYNAACMGCPRPANLPMYSYKPSLHHGYHPCPIIPGLWAHTSCNIHFTLVVNNFAIRYTEWDNADHLLTALKEHYQVTEDWEASWYCRLSIT